MSFAIRTFGDPAAKDQLVQLTGAGESSFLEREFLTVCELAGRSDIGLTAVLVDDWNIDLSPWEAPPAFGDEAFGSGAPETLDQVLNEVVPQIRANAGTEAGLYLGGYSLAGLFALWAGFQTGVFAGIAGASPSVWFPGFESFAKGHAMKTRRVYLSLGTKEEKTRNPVMGAVGAVIRDLHGYFTASGIETALEWNPGNHFKEPDLRMAKGFAWLIRQATGGHHESGSIEG